MGQAYGDEDVVVVSCSTKGRADALLSARVISLIQLDEDMSMK